MVRKKKIKTPVTSNSSLNNRRRHRHTDQTGAETSQGSMRQMTRGQGLSHAQNDGHDTHNRRGRSNRNGGTSLDLRTSFNEPGSVVHNRTSNPWQIDDLRYSGSTRNMVGESDDFILPNESPRNRNRTRPYLQRNVSSHHQNLRGNDHQGQRGRDDRMRQNSRRRPSQRSWQGSTTSALSVFSENPSEQTNTQSPIERDDSLSSSSSANSSDLPGFYFDPVKKRYFRIMPSHLSAGPSTVTRESLKEKYSEEARQRSLQEFALRAIQKDPAYGLGQNCSNRYPHRLKTTSNISELIHNLRGALLRTTLPLDRDKIINHKLKQMQPSCRQKVLDRTLGSDMINPKLEHMTRMIFASDVDTNTSDRRILCLWSLRSLLAQRIQYVRINRVARTDGCAIMDASPGGIVLTPSLSKVTDICWLSKANGTNSNAAILYTTTCIMGTNPSLAKIRHLDPLHESESNSVPRNMTDTEFHLGNKTTWSCAWNPHANKFSVGLQECSVVIDVPTRRLWELHTKKSDALCQTFSNMDGNALYSGTRRGDIFVHDLRSCSTRWVTTLGHKSSISHLHMMRSTNHLLASDFSGKLSMWDLRTRRVVMDFKGHNNEYTRIPFMLDPEERVLCSAGQDCYTRIWDVRTAELLVSIPPPYPASRDLIPSVCVFPSPTGHIDRPCLIMGIKDELHLYTS